MSTATGSLFVPERRRNLDCAKFVVVNPWDPKWSKFQDRWNSPEIVPLIRFWSLHPPCASKNGHLRILNEVFDEKHIFTVEILEWDCDISFPGNQSSINNHVHEVPCHHPSTVCMTLLICNVEQQTSTNAKLTYLVVNKQGRYRLVYQMRFIYFIQPYEQVDAAFTEPIWTQSSGSICCRPQTKDAQLYLENASIPSFCQWPSYDQYHINKDEKQLVNKQNTVHLNVAITCRGKKGPNKLLIETPSLRSGFQKFTWWWR